MTENPLILNFSFLFRYFLRCPACLFLPFSLWMVWPAGAMTETFGTADATAVNTVLVVFKTHLDVVGREPALPVPDRKTQIAHNGFSKTITRTYL